MLQHSVMLQLSQEETKIVSENTGEAGELPDSIIARYASSSRQSVLT